MKTGARFAFVIKNAKVGSGLRTNITHSPQYCTQKGKSYFNSPRSRAELYLQNRGAGAQTCRILYKDTLKQGTYISLQDNNDNGVRGLLHHNSQMWDFKLVYTIWCPLVFFSFPYAAKGENDIKKREQNINYDRRGCNADPPVVNRLLLLILFVIQWHTRWCGRNAPNEWLRA